MHLAAMFGPCYFVLPEAYSGHKLSWRLMVFPSLRARHPDASG